MLIRDATSSLEVSLRELGPRGTQAEGDVGVHIAATSAANRLGGPFTGTNGTIWIGRHEWATFLEDVRELDRTRQGEAHLMAMSPAEFQLAIFATDRAGHLAAEGWVGREYVGRNGALEDRVCFSIEVDPSTLPQILRQLEAIVPGA